MCDELSHKYCLANICDKSNEIQSKYFHNQMIGWTSYQLRERTLYFET
jgi:hypothetical protein